MDRLTNSTPIKPQFRFLWILMLTYTMTLAFANWFDPRLIRVFNIVTDAGTLIFPLSYIVSDIITEVYGYKHARRAIWTGFLFNIIFIAYGWLVTHMPSPDYQTLNPMFDKIIAMDGRIIAASIVSYLIAEPLNSFIMAKLKIKTKGKFISLRFVSSTFFASALDSTIFGIMAFAGFMSNKNLTLLIVTMWLIKVIIEVICLPISITLARKIKRIEQMDIYDIDTNFTLFSLDSSYKQADNKMWNKTLLDD